MSKDFPQLFRLSREIISGQDLEPVENWISARKKMDPISKFNSLSLVFESTNLKATLETKSDFSYHVLKQREFLAIE